MCSDYAVNVKCQQRKTPGQLKSMQSEEYHYNNLSFFQCSSVYKFLYFKKKLHLFHVHLNKNLILGQIC